MRYDPEHKARTRERILKEAAAALRSDGVEGVGVAAIMTRAGLTHGGFYAHFASKDALLADTIGHLFDERCARFAPNLAAADPRAALGRFIDAYLSMAHRNAPDKGCPIPGLAAALPRLAEPARERFDDGAARLVRGLAELLARASIADAEAQAQSAFAELVGALSLARARTDRRQAEMVLKVSRESLRRRLGLQAEP